MQEKILAEPGMIDVDRGRLEFPPDPQAVDLVFVEAREVGVAPELDLAGVGFGSPGQQVKKSRLARAVRADDHAHLAAIEVEIEVGDRLEAVERLVHALHREDEFFLHRGRMAGAVSAAAGFGPAAGGSAARLFRQLAIRRRNADDPARQEEDDEDKQGSEDDQPKVRKSARGPAFQGIDEDGPDDRAHEGAAAADGDPDHSLQRLGGRHFARIDPAHLGHVERARQGGDDRADDKDEELEVGGGIAREEDTVLAVAHRPLHLAEFGRGQPFAKDDRWPRSRRPVRDVEALLSGREAGAGRSRR